MREMEGRGMGRRGRGGGGKEREGRERRRVRKERYRHCRVNTNFYQPSQFNVSPGGDPIISYLRVDPTMAVHQWIQQ